VTRPLFCLLGLLAAASDAWAKPDFSQSTIAADSTAVEGDVVTFTMVLRNSGDQDAPGTALEIQLPHEAMFVDLSGLENATVDPHAKLVTAAIDLPASAERHVSFRVVVPRDAGGNALNPSFSLKNLYLSTQHSASAWIDIDTRVSTSGFAIGGVRLGRVELALIAILALYPLLWLVVRSHGPVFALVLSVGFWTIFATMAWRDWQTVNAWRQSTCTILDSRLRGETISSTGSGPRGARTTQSTAYKALLALNYPVDGQEIVSTGFDTDSRLGIGGAQRALEDVSRWPIGTTVPCWFDPDNVSDVVVIPGFGGAYLFALFPLPVFIYGLMAIRKR
jgi:uncharacterized repeat protein (TIGR01451 family)